MATFLRSRASTLGAVAVVVVGTVVTGAGGAVAAPATPGPDIQVSGASTLTGCAAGASADFAEAYSNTEVEPQVAVNPLDPRVMVGVTQQDRWPDGGARGLTSWRSTNGGSSWSKLPDVPWSACQGGPARFGRVTDPWVSYDAAGIAYFIGQPIDLGDPARSAISVTSMPPTANTWGPPTILIEDNESRGVTNDKVSVTGDPTRPGHAYATWLRTDFPSGQRHSENADFHSFAFRGLPMFSRTTDGGATWSTPVSMRNSNGFYQGNQIAVGPDGTLYNVTATLFTGAGIQPNLQGVYMGVMRSIDGGLHWSAPVKIAPIRTEQLFVPDDNFPIRAGDFIPDIAIDPGSGAIYVVWSDGLGTPIDKVVLSRSTDGGRHWTSPAVVAANTAPNVQSYNHAVEVTPNGTVFVSFYDDRNNVLGDGVATTDVWLRHSHDGGVTWTEAHLHGPFDHYRAPISFFAPGVPRGLFLGDYVGLETRTGNDVVTFFSSTISDGADVHAVSVTHP